MAPDFSAAISAGSSTVAPRPMLTRTPRGPSAASTRASISPLVPGGPETTGLIDARLLAALGPHGILVNIGRGATVDEPALIAALKSRTILAAGLDVFTDEPNVPAELIALDNAVLLPHVASASVHTRTAMGDLMVANLDAWFAGRLVLTPVAETPWPRP